MITLHRSAVQAEWVELREGEQVLDEVEVRFRFRHMNKTFVSVEEAKKFLHDTERKQAKNYACYLLSARSYASELLGKKLSEKGYSADVVQETVQKLTDLGLLQDEQWQQREVERELARGHGPRFIEAKWRAKGLPNEPVRKYMTDEMQRDKLKQLWQKLGKKSDRRKAIGFLARRGFDLDLIMQICNTEIG
jgi:regulatory protein